MIVGLPRGSIAVDELRRVEWHEAALLSSNMRLYLSSVKDPVFSPAVPGCGVVDEAEADIRSNSTLIEVKTVNRPFRSSDFRQVLTYAAMYYASSVEINAVTILNPRLGDVASSTLEDIAVGVSGRSKVELMQEIVSFMTDIQISA
jgi:hypothetical protein